ncbi:MAG: hypothetical protein OXD42_12785 [Rhodospirillaceae bacterium]|nr:hypothetical protein [Rhodospirillaceae bacterium]MCY4237948.1 hypothetical protein [Rhodospirillaceae bacterium]
MKETRQDMNPEVEAALRALRKSAQKARETAIQTSTALVIVENGKLMRIPAEQLVAEEKKR